MKISFWKLVHIVAVAAVCTAGSMIATTAQAAEPDTLNVGIANTSSDAGFFIADAKGYFKDVGLKVNLIPFSSAAVMIAPLASGQLDVAGGTVAAGLYNASLRKVDIKVVADKGSIKEGYEYSTLLVRKDLIDSGRYKTLADLKGMTVAIAAKGAGSASSLNEALKKGGLTMKDVKTVYLGFPEHLIALENKKIDASITNEPTVTRAIQEGVAERGSKTAIYPGQQTAAVLYSEAFIEQRRPVAERFMLAYVRALREYNDALSGGKLAGPKGKEVISILTKYTPIKDPAVYRAITPNAANPDGRVNEETLQNDLNFFQSQGIVAAGKIKVKDVVDNSFVDHAVARLGPYRPLQATAPAPATATASN